MKTRFLSSARMIAASLVLSLAASGCDTGDLPLTPPEGSHEGGSAASEPALLGRVLLDSDELVPVSQAQVIVELTGTSEHDPIELGSDDEGYFELSSVPTDVTELTAYVFIDGELAGSEVVAVEDGQPVKKIIGVIVVTAWVVCIATTWASARKISGSDKLRHCVASCRATRWCGGPASAWTAGILKETFDALCSTGPQWLKNILQPASGCSGWDSADLAANNKGIWCAARWKTCENCCNDYY